MKLKVLVVTVLLIIGSISLTYSEIYKSNIEERIVFELKNARITALNCRTQLTQIISRLEDISGQYSSKIDSADKIILSGYPAEIQKTITQVNSLIVKIDTDFPSIQLSDTKY